MGERSNVRQGIRLSISGQEISRISRESELAGNGSRANRRERQCYSNHAASTFRSIADFDASTVRLCDLTREHQTYSASIWLGGVERGEHITRIRKARPVIFNAQRKVGELCAPPHGHAARILR